MTIEELKRELKNCKIKNRKLICMSPKMTTYNTIAARSDEFKKSELYAEVMSKTRFLPENASIPFRLRCVMTECTVVPKCPICGKPCKPTFSLSAHQSCFCHTCGDTLCVSKRASDKIERKTDMQKKHMSVKMREYKSSLIKVYAKFLSEYVNKKFDTIREADVISHFKSKLESRIKNAAIVKDSDFLNENELTMMSNLMKLTSFVDAPATENNITSKTDFRFNERIYCLVNGIREKQKCKYCGKDAKFISVTLGYAKSCPECSNDKFRESMSCPTMQEMLDSIDKDKYDIISAPKHVTCERLLLKCKKCGNTLSFDMSNGRGRDMSNHIFCKTCYCNDFTSRNETEILETLKSSYSGKIIHCDRTAIAPLELDIYLPDLKLAIEHDGLYWHNSEKVKPGYHMLKTRMAEKAGIRLIHIFENEWLTKKEIVKSRLLNLVGKYEKTIYARKCEIRQTEKSEARKFLNENHIQGAVNSSVCIGLYFDDKLISLMTFGKCRFDKRHEWEMLRFCNKLGHHVPGAASRLLTYFEKNWKPKSLVTYADRRWSNGNVYKALGFIFSHNSNINYWYFNDYRNPVLMSRINFQKHKLKEKLQIFDPSKTEVENMSANGYFRIFDCGNMVFEKTY